MVLSEEQSTGRLQSVPVQISDLRRCDLPKFFELVRLGFERELSQRGTDFQGLERLLRVLLLAGGIPLRLLTRLTRSEAIVLTAKSDGQVVGCLAVLGHGEPFVIGASVLPAFRDQGIGLALIEEAVRHLRSRGHHRVRGAAISEGGQRIAERAGFVVCGERILYVLTLPREVPLPAGVTVRRARWRDRSIGNATDCRFEWDDPRRPYEAPVVRRLLGAHLRSITVLDSQGPALRCTLSTLKAQTIGEIRPQLAPESGRAFLGCLSEGSRWLSRLAKREAYLYLPPTETRLAGVALQAGFQRRHSWVQLAMDL